MTPDSQIGVHQEHQHGSDAAGYRTRMVGQTAEEELHQSDSPTPEPDEQLPHASLSASSSVMILDIFGRRHLFTLIKWG